MAKASPSLLLFLFLLPCCPSFRADTRKALQTRTDAHTQTRNAGDLAPAEEAAEEAKVSESASKVWEGEPTVANKAAVAAAPETAGAEETAEREAPKKPTARQVQDISLCLEHVQELKALGKNGKNIWHAVWAGTFAAIGDLLKSLRGDFLQIGDDHRQSWNQRWIGIWTVVDRLINTLDRRTNRRMHRRLRREIAFVSRQLQEELKRGISSDVKKLQMQLEALGSFTMLQTGSWGTLAELGLKLATLQELNKLATLQRSARQHQWSSEHVKERQELQELQEADAAKFNKLKERLSEAMKFPMKGSLQTLLDDFQAEQMTTFFSNLPQ